VLAAVVRMQQVDPSSDSVRLETCYQIVTASRRLESPDMPLPSLQTFAAAASGYGDPVQTWLAIDDAGRAVGCYVVTFPMHENQDRAWCLLAVAPERRRSGAGTLLLRHCAGRAREAGRRWLAAEAMEDSPGAAFALSLGATKGIAFVQRRLDFDGGLAGRLRMLRAEAASHASGYTLMSWLGVTPDEQLADAARLSAAMADAPSDEGVEPEVWDADRIRYMEQAMTDQGKQLFSVAARHDGSGSLVAVTQIRVDPGEPGWARQSITAVLPEHRGHRLGLLVKVEMLEFLARTAPAVRHIFAHNAGANEHMVAINEKLGFTISSVHRDWELDLTVPVPGSKP
jgi:GNAT superfamily N-acetyltransferase